MLYWLAGLSDDLTIFNVFRYITFRAAGAILTALLLSLLLGPRFIRMLRRLSVGQSILDVAPETHQQKAGTPTMGGLLILFAVTVATLLWARLDNPYVWLVLGVTLAFGTIGFADDYLKVRRSHNRGLSARAKFFFSALVAISAGVVLVLLPEEFAFEASVALPFFFKTNIAASARGNEAAKKMTKVLVDRSAHTADEVAAYTLAEAGKGTLHILYPRQAKIIWHWKRLLPGHYFGTMLKRARDTARFVERLTAKTEKTKTLH